MILDYVWLVAGITADSWLKSVFVVLMDVFKSNHLDITKSLLDELGKLIASYEPHMEPESHKGVSNCAMFNAALDSLYVRLVPTAWPNFIAVGVLGRWMLYVFYFAGRPTVLVKGRMPAALNCGIGLCWATRICASLLRPWRPRCGLWRA